MISVVHVPPSHLAAVYETKISRPTTWMKEKNTPFLCGFSLVASSYEASTIVRAAWIPNYWIIVLFSWVNIWHLSVYGATCLLRCLHKVKCYFSLCFSLYSVVNGTVLFVSYYSVLTERYSLFFLWILSSVYLKAFVPSVWKFRQGQDRPIAPKKWRMMTRM